MMQFLASLFLTILATSLIVQNFSFVNCENTLEKLNRTGCNAVTVNETYASIIMGQKQFDISEGDIFKVHYRQRYLNELYYMTYFEKNGKEFPVWIPSENVLVSPFK